MNSMYVEDDMPNEIDTTVDLGAMRELAGWEHLGELSAKCRTCNKPLFRVVRVSDKQVKFKWGKKVYNLVEQKFSSNCPFCGDKSLIVSGKGTIIVGPEEGVSVVETNIGEPLNNILHNELELVKT